MAPLIIPESFESNKRHAVRVDISPKDPVRFAVGKQKAVIENVSESGISFRVPEKIQEKVLQGVLKFKIDQVYTLRVQLEVMMVKGDSYGARFVNMSDRESKLMSRLVLGLQKLHIRRRKQKRAAEMKKKMLEASAAEREES